MIEEDVRPTRRYALSRAIAADSDRIPISERLLVVRARLEGDAFRRGQAHAGAKAVTFEEEIVKRGVLLSLEA